MLRPVSEGYGRNTYGLGRFGVRPQPGHEQFIDELIDGDGGRLFRFGVRPQPGRNPCIMQALEN